MQNERPLSGYRVVELATFMAAPSAARQMADWGAEVIKVETPVGDAFRYFGPTMMMPAKEDENPIWELYNTNKQSVVIDLKTAEGQQVFHDLLATADVFVTNNRPAALKKLNLDYDSLKEKYPKLVYSLITGFGEEGPDADQPGYDVVAFWARSGFMVDLVKPDEYPVYAPSGFGDLAAASVLFGGVCAALLKRNRTGKGEKISVSLYGSAVWFSSAIITSTQERYANKYPKPRLEGNPMASPYRCKDGEWIILSILEHERYWTTFCKTIGREDIVNDERFKTRASLMSNISHKTALILILEETFKTKNQAEWVAILREADIVHDKLRHFSDVLADEQAWANNFLHKHTFANGSQAILPCPPTKAVEAPPLSYSKAPLLGENTKEVLAQLGYSNSRIEELCRKKVVKSK